VLDTFDKLREREESRFGYYRSKALVLEAYRQMVPATTVLNTA